MENPKEFGKRREEAAIKWVDENTTIPIERSDLIEAFKAGSVYQIYQTRPAYEIYAEGWAACGKERDVFYSNLQEVLAGYRQAAQAIVSGNAPADLPMLQEAKYSWACDVLKSAIADDKRWADDPLYPLTTAQQATDPEGNK